MKKFRIILCTMFFEEGLIIINGISCLWDEVVNYKLFMCQGGRPGKGGEAVVNWGDQHDSS